MAGALVAQLRPMRDHAKLSQEELARRLGWAGKGAHSHVGRVERGERNTELETLEKWIDACDHNVYLVPRSSVPSAEHAVPLLLAAGSTGTDLLLRLARVIPRLDDAALDRLKADVEYLERRHTGATLALNR